MSVDIVAARALGRTAHPVRRWGWIEIFILIQVLSPGLLFLPGAQALRFAIRALPYTASLALLLMYASRPNPTPLPAWGRLLCAALLVLPLSLAHPATQIRAGVAQCVFQLSIAAPAFWAGKTVRRAAHLEYLIRLIFLASLVSAALGLLQVYSPGRFMPPEFNARLTPEFFASLSYVGPGGRQIIRPPGLSDMPGGASVAGITVAILGTALGVRSRRARSRAWFYYAGAGVGMCVLYLTLVRSLALLMLAALLAMGVVATLQRQHAEGRKTWLMGSALIIASFTLALSLGGERVRERFLNLFQAGLVESYGQSRGLVLQATMKDLVFEYPLGAGVGRWGMMQSAFGESVPWRSSALFVEIQHTGWLYDGGLLLWALYAGALAAAMLFTWRLALGRSPASRAVRWSARLIFCIQLIEVGMTFAGPTFNTQLGIQFWMLTAALYGAAAGERAAAPR